jgi:hypothetical protein
VGEVLRGGVHAAEYGQGERKGEVGIRTLYSVAADVRRLSTLRMVRERVSLVTSAATGVDLVAADVRRLSTRLAEFRLS